MTGPIQAAEWSRDHTAGHENGIALFSVGNKNSYERRSGTTRRSPPPRATFWTGRSMRSQAKDFSDSLSTAVRNADTVQNHRGTHPLPC